MEPERSPKDPGIIFLMDLFETWKNPYVDDVQFISVEPQQSSFKIGVLSEKHSTLQFIHLPPFHKLLTTHEAVELLRRSTIHRVRYSRDPEPIVTNLDGVELIDLWLFLHAKQV
jgi:hypothetical protein